MREQRDLPGELLQASANGSGTASTPPGVHPTLQAAMYALCRQLILACLLLWSVVPAVAAPRVESCHRRGDDPRWAAPDWDDRDWTQGNTVPTRDGVYWVRFRLKLVLEEHPLLLPDPPKRDASGLGYGAVIDSIFMAAPYSYELYWDGRLLGRSGRVGATREEEITGPLDNVMVIPGELLRPGPHVVAVRLSSFHYNFPTEQIDIGFLLSNLAGHYASEIHRPVFPMVGLGGALLVGLISAVLFRLVDQRRPLLLCSFISFALALFYLLIAWRWLHNDPYEWFWPRLVTITCVMTFIAAFFPWLLLEQFAVPRRAWWLAALGPVLVAAWLMPSFYEIKSLWLCRAMLAWSLGIAGWAAWHRRTGAWFVFGGALAGLLLVRADRREFLNPWFFAIFSVLVLYLFTMLGLQLRADRQRTQAALLTAARLEAELLKKNLQPHFLLNTLTAVSEVIEQDPAGAVKFIDDLAAVFRSLAAMSGERLVPLQRELELCRTHLKVVGRRTGRELGLQTNGLEEATLVPPALFLTLIENGLVYQQAKAGEHFQLSARGAKDRLSFAFLSPGRLREAPGRPSGGTGLRYVKARLEESFPGRWTLSQGAVEAGWETVIGWQAGPADGGTA